MTDREEILHKEIDLVQAVISRMANNSFFLKGWLVSLIAVVLALTKDAVIAFESPYYSLIILLPVIAFWYLDAFFLHKERCYRKLYDWVIENRKNTDDYLYSLNYKRFEKQVGNIFCVMFSKTLIPFYGLVVFILIILTVYRSFNYGK
jgi:hypothetical protein